jgi:hypothetical protein
MASLRKKKGHFFFFAWLAVCSLHLAQASSVTDQTARESQLKHKLHGNCTFPQFLIVFKGKDLPIFIVLCSPPNGFLFIAAVNAGVEAFFRCSEMEDKSTIYLR